MWKSQSANIIPLFGNDIDIPFTQQAQLIGFIEIKYSWIVFFDTSERMLAEKILYSVSFNIYTNGYEIFYCQECQKL